MVSEMSAPLSAGYVDSLKENGWVSGHAASDPKATIAEVEDDIRRVRNRAERMGELVAVTDGVRGCASSRGRDVIVEVDASGHVLKLQISNQAVMRGGSRLAAELMGLMEQARADAQAQLLAAAVKTLGDDDPALETLRSGSNTRAIQSSEVPGSASNRLPRPSGGLW